MKRNVSWGSMIAMIGMIALFSGSAVAQTAIVSLDHVDGVHADDATKLKAGEQITIYIRTENLTGHDGMCPSSGFKLYSPDGATWSPHIYVDTNIIPIPPPTHTTFPTFSK